MLTWDAQLTEVIGEVIGGTYLRLDDLLRRQASALSLLIVGVTVGAELGVGAEVELEVLGES